MILFLALALSAAPVPSGPLSLDEAVRIARTNHPDLVGAHADTQTAEAQASEARAGLLPQLSASASYTRVGGPAYSSSNSTSSTTSTTSTASGGNDSYTASLSASQLVWDFGKTSKTYRASRLTADAAGSTEHETENTVVHAVRTAYFEAQARAAFVRDYAQTEEDLRKTMEKVAAMVEVGSKASADLASARSDWASAKVDTVKARASERSARAQLLQSLGLAQMGEVTLSKDGMGPLPSEAQGLEALVAVAVESRPSLKALKTKIEAQEATLSSANAAWLPSLSVAGALTTDGAKIDDLRGGWSAGATLSWSFFDGGASAAKIREAEWTRTSLLAQLESASQSIRYAIAKAVTSLEGAKASQEAATEALASANEALRLAQAKYQTGAGTLLDVNDAESKVSKARIEIVQADWDLSVARADLAYALGNGI